MKDSQPNKVAKHFNGKKPHRKMYVVGISVIFIISVLGIIILVGYLIRQTQVVSPPQQTEKVIVDTSKQKNVETKIADQIVDVSDMPQQTEKVIVDTSKQKMLRQKLLTKL